MDDDGHSTEEPSASVTSTLVRQVLPVLVTSIEYDIVSPARANWSTTVARLASSSGSGKHEVREQ